MQFVNIIVHSVEDMNFRVHLQYEFTALKLDDYLERLRFCESEDLQVHCTMFTGRIKIDGMVSMFYFCIDYDTRPSRHGNVHSAHCDLRFLSLSLSEYLSLSTKLVFSVTLNVDKVGCLRS